MGFALLLGVGSIVAIADDVKSEHLGITGTVKYHKTFPSEFVAPRNVEVWLPPSYEENAVKRYPVVYMHDGQNLFDPKTSFLKIDWGVDETMTRLIAEKKAPEAIVVGIWNTPRRTLEYMPQKMITWMNTSEKYKDNLKDRRRFRLDEDRLLADKYLKFIVEELKPFIDKEYRTLPGREHTSMMGSSAGAMVSLYAISEYPEIIGGAGCVSTHFPFADGALVNYIADKLPDPATHKIYFDFGTETLDHNYEPYQKRMDEVMAQRGYEPDKNWITRKFEGHEHSERAWRKRVHVPLRFLLNE